MGSQSRNKQEFLWELKIAVKKRDMSAPYIYLAMENGSSINHPELAVIRVCTPVMSIPVSRPSGSPSSIAFFKWKQAKAK